MEFFRLYLNMLRDPSIPAHRIMRKTTSLTALALTLLVHYRHFHLGFGSGEAILVTLMLGFQLLFIVGILGGLLAGVFYEAFLKAVGAQQHKESSIVVFFTEWLFAAVAPVLGAIAFGFISRAE
jgi:hypothetical protein